jgi:hypothetical protein
MPIMLTEIYDAFKEAKVSDETARRAAEAVASYDERLSRIDGRLGSIDGRLTGVEARLTMLTWAVGLNVAATLGVLWRLLAHA